MHTKLSTPLSNFQLELLKIYSFNPSNEDLQEIKTMLGKYFSQKLTNKINRAVEEKGISNNDLDNWLNEKNQ